jgi:hypothetical protein
MTLEQIKARVDGGKIVHWANEAYQVIGDYHNGYVIQCIDNRSCIGLTWTDGKTLNGAETEFYLKEEI